MVVETELTFSLNENFLKLTKKVLIIGKISIPSDSAVMSLGIRKPPLKVAVCLNSSISKKWWEEPHFHFKTMFYFYPERTFQ